MNYLVENLRMKMKKRLKMNFLSLYPMQPVCPSCRQFLLKSRKLILKRQPLVKLIFSFSFGIVYRWLNNTPVIEFFWWDSCMRLADRFCIRFYQMKIFSLQIRQCLKSLWMHLIFFLLNKFRTENLKMYFWIIYSITCL